MKTDNTTISYIISSIPNTNSLQIEPVDIILNLYNKHIKTLPDRVNLSGRWGITEHISNNGSYTFDFTPKHWKNYKINITINAINSNVKYRLVIQEGIACPSNWVEVYDQSSVLKNADLFYLSGLSTEIFCNLFENDLNEFINNLKFQVPTLHVY